MTTKPRDAIVTEMEAVADKTTEVQHGVYLKLIIELLLDLRDSPGMMGWSPTTYK